MNCEEIKFKFIEMYEMLQIVRPLEMWIYFVNSITNFCGLEEHFFSQNT